MMATTIILNIAYIVSLISLVPLSKCDFPNGLTIDLIESNSFGSPYHDPSLSPSQILVNAFRRSINRLQPNLNAKISTQSAQTDITNYGGEYFVNYSVGTPPVPSVGTFDTASDLIWMQCQPCGRQCAQQKSPIFNPKNSSTYRNIACNSTQCKSFPESSCSKTPSNKCSYSLTYGDGSFSDGHLSNDTITLASSTGGKNVVPFPNIIFGCGFNNDIPGIVGFGGGEVSLVRQLGQGKFSYCLVSLSSESSSSKLNFGDNAVVLGSGVVSTPLVTKKQKPTFYYVTLKGISVGNQSLRFPHTTRGNIIVASGTTMTMLPNDFYNKLRTALASSIKLNQTKDPNQVSDLCFSTKKDITNFPAITVHFNGADVKWKQDNIFARLSEDLLCLAAQGAPPNGDAIYGSLAQTNFLVGFDLQKSTVSFKPTRCG